MPTTRTLNPLHFQDLEPHRFEDLVRQLAYGYRTWRSLEATGRIGKDGGLDIRGVERVFGLEGPQGEDGEAGLDESGLEDREWRIQVKRYKEIGPSKVREIVEETVPAGSAPPHGLIIAAACDVSGRTLAAFREEAIARGVQEHHIWSKAHLEDVLFLAENDHLLFAYFDISLQVRRRSRVQGIRSDLALKRKLLRALDTDDVEKMHHAPILIRSVDDEDYPTFDSVPAFGELENAPWHRVEGRYVGVNIVVVCRFRYRGWLRPDGVWDLYPDTRDLPPSISRWAWYWKDAPEFGRRDVQSPRMSAGRSKLVSAVGQSEDADWPDDIHADHRREIEELRKIPFDNLLEVDPIGDVINPMTHLFCRFDAAEGPYAEASLFVARPAGSYHAEWKELDPDKRLTATRHPSRGRTPGARASRVEAGSTARSAPTRRRASIMEINAALRAMACSGTYEQLTAVEAAAQLDRLGLLPDSPSRPGKPLRDLLRAGKIESGRQEANGRWFIRCVDRDVP